MSHLPPVAILAGGLATRLRPLTEMTPKALLPVNGEPFIAHQLRLLAAGGVERALLCVGHLGEMIQEFVGDGSQFQMAVEFSFDGAALLGTAGAVKQALPQLGREFFVLYGDAYLPCDYQAVATAFRASGREGLMTVFGNDGKWDASNVEFSDGKIRAYDKKHRTSSMQYIDYGLGVFRDSAFAQVPGGQPQDLADLYKDLLARDALAAFESFQRFYEIGSKPGLDELSAYLAARIDSESEQ